MQQQDQPYSSGCRQGRQSRSYRRQTTNLSNDNSAPAPGDRQFYAFCKPTYPAAAESVDINNFLPGPFSLRPPDRGPAPSTRLRLISALAFHAKCLLALDRQQSWADAFSWPTNRLSHSHRHHATSEIGYVRCETLTLSITVAFVKSLIEPWWGAITA